MNKHKNRVKIYTNNKGRIVLEAPAMDKKYKYNSLDAALAEAADITNCGICKKRDKRPRWRCGIPIEVLPGEFEFICENCYRTKYKTSVVVSPGRKIENVFLSGEMAYYSSYSWGVKPFLCSLPSGNFSIHAIVFSENLENALGDFLTNEQTKTWCLLDDENAQEYENEGWDIFYDDCGNPHDISQLMIEEISFKSIEFFSGKKK